MFLIYVDTWTCFAGFPKKTRPACQPGPRLSLSHSPGAKDGDHLSLILHVAEFARRGSHEIRAVAPCFYLPVLCSRGKEEQCNEGIRVFALDSDCAEMPVAVTTGYHYRFLLPVFVVWLRRSLFVGRSWSAIIVARLSSGVSWNVSSSYNFVGRPV